MSKRIIYTCDRCHLEFAGSPDNESSLTLSIGSGYGWLSKHRQICSHVCRRCGEAVLDQFDALVEFAKG